MEKGVALGKGVRVIEYEADYSLAVKEGRMQAKQDPYCYFIDDEHSWICFWGMPLREAV